MRIAGTITKPLLKLFADKSSNNSPLRDYIFQDFMAAKNDKLAVKLPGNLRQLIVNNQQLNLGWVLLFKWAGLFIIVSLLDWLIFYFENESSFSGIFSISLSVILMLINANLQAIILGLYGFKMNFRLQFAWCLSQIILSVPIIVNFFIDNSLISNLIRIEFVDSDIFTLFCVFFIYGTVQYSLVRQIFNKTNSWYWLISTWISMLSAWIIIIFIDNNITNYNVITYCIVGGMQGILYGVITGATLVWILRQPVREKKKQKSRPSFIRWITSILVILTSIAGIFYLFLERRIDDPKGTKTRPPDVWERIGGTGRR